MTDNTICPRPTRLSGLVLQRYQALSDSLLAAGPLRWRAGWLRDKVILRRFNHEMEEATLYLINRRAGDALGHGICRWGGRHGPSAAVRHRPRQLRGPG